MKQRNLYHCLLALGAIALLCTEANARAPFVANVPTSLGCATCHVNAAGGGARNVFGQDYETNGALWQNICQLDSDEDGSTNGEELGDPDCEWAPGDNLPPTAQTHPADADDFPEPPPEADMAVVPIEDAGVSADMGTGAGGMAAGGAVGTGGMAEGGSVGTGGMVEGGAAGTGGMVEGGTAGTGGAATGGTPAGGSNAGGTPPPATEDDDDGGCAINSDRELPSGTLLFGLLLLGLYRRRR